MLGTSAYLRQFSTAISKWNNYKPGVITGPLSNLSSSVDLTISDYYEDSNTVAVTSSSGTIRFNTKNMNENSEERQIHTCIHELGHALGLDHRREDDSVVYPYNTGYTYLNAMDKWNYDHAYARY